MSPLKTWEMGGRKIGMRRIRWSEVNAREGWVYRRRGDRIERQSVDMKYECRIR
jgi:hypothetical protein